MSGHTDDAVLDLGIKLRGTALSSEAFHLHATGAEGARVLDGKGEPSRPR